MGREKEQGERKKCEWVGTGRSGRRRQKGTNIRKTERRGRAKERCLGGRVVWFGEAMVEGIRASFTESERGITIARELRRDSEGKTEKPVTGVKEKLLQRCQIREQDG